MSLIVKIRCRYFRLNLALSFLFLLKGLSAITPGPIGVAEGFLYNGADARAWAMGRAMTAYADDINALYYNPACLVLDGDGAFTFMQLSPIPFSLSTEPLDTEWAKTMYNFIGIKLPVGGLVPPIPWLGTLGLSVSHQSYNGAHLFNELFDPEAMNGFFTISQAAASISYGKRLFLFPFRITSVGVTARMVRQSVTFPDDYLKLSETTPVTTDFDLDIGILQQINASLYAGMSVKHVLTPELSVFADHKTRLPMLFKAGVAYLPHFQPKHKGLYKIFGNTLFTLDIDYVLSTAYDIGFNYHIGVEKRFYFLLKNAIAVIPRVGINDIGIIGGTGLDFELTYGVGGEFFDIFKVDLAADINILGVLNRVAASASFVLDLHTGAEKYHQRQRRKYMIENNYIQAQASYYAALEVNPKNFDMYQNIKNLEKRVREQSRQRPDDFKELNQYLRHNAVTAAGNFLATRKDRSYFPEMMKAYLNKVSEKLARLKARNKRTRFALFARTQIECFPKHQGLRRRVDSFQWFDYKKKPKAESFTVKTVSGKAARIKLRVKDLPGTVLTLKITQPKKGRVESITPENENLSPDNLFLRYTPRPGFSGKDSFRYKVHNGVSSSNIGTVVILVAAGVDTPSPGETTPSNSSGSGEK